LAALSVIWSGARDSRRRRKAPLLVPIDPVKYREVL
jgi:hypothetical protein